MRQSEIGWVLEIDIPFRTLAFDPNAPAWGINFQRTVRRKNEELLWTGHQRNQGLRRMSNAGLLVGLTDVSQGRGFELKPYVAGYRRPTHRAARRRCRARRAGDVGVDVAYNITPSLRGVATINTDFAETEVDQRRVNLTRFPLVLAGEARTFFLDGATFFDFPDHCLLLAAHRPGRRATRSAIIGGGKLTGQAGRTTSAPSTCARATTTARPGERLPGGPVRRRVLRQSYFGAFYTGRVAHGGRRSSTATARWAPTSGSATSTFLGNKNLTATGYCGGQLDRPTVSATARAYGGRVDYPNDIWEATADVPGGAEGLRPGGRLHAATGVPPLQSRIRPGVRGRNPPPVHPPLRLRRWNPTIFTDLQNRRHVGRADTAAVPARTAQR